VVTSARVTPPPRGDLIRLRASEFLPGVLVTAVYGAATLRGRVGVAGAEGGPPKSLETLRVYLVPQERERAEDPARYAEAALNEDGAFEFEGLAPGRYWMLARAAPHASAAAVAPGDEGPAQPPPPFLDEGERARLRREAEAAAPSVTLSPCQKVEDYALVYAPAKN
jgi:hypothetical protein